MARLSRPLITILAASATIAAFEFELGMRVALPVASWTYLLDAQEDALMVEDPLLGYALRPGKVEQWTRPAGIAVENRGDHAGAVRLQVLRGVSKEDTSFVWGAIDGPGTTVATDGPPTYHGLRPSGVRHRRYVPRARTETLAQLPWVHTVAGNLKTWLRGIFHGVSPKHLPRYLDEFSYHFDRRWREKELFGFVLCRVAHGESLFYLELVAERAA